MTTLMIDTTQECAKIALVFEGKIVREETLHEPRQLSKTLMPLLATFPLKKLDAVAIATGPGSYTGTRVGAIIGQTLSFALGIPLVTFSQFLPEEMHKKYLNQEFSPNSQAELLYLN